jgi:carboxymethylenebutenolidase
MLRTLFDRRDFIAASLAAGAGLLAPPLWSAPLQTDSEGLVASDVMVPIQGGQIAAYSAYPAKGGPFSTILVAHDLAGVNEHIKDVVRRLAKLGYYVLCPNLFSRQTDLGKNADMMDVMRMVVSKLIDAQILSDLDSTVAFAKKTGKASVERLGITGFGWGGRVVWLYAAHDAKVKAGVAWCGFLTAPRDPNGHSAISLAAEIKPAVLGLYAGNDDYIMSADIEQMKFALKGKKSEIVEFPTVRHGFYADDDRNYDAKTAADGWDRMQSWFRRNGVT